MTYDEMFKYAKRCADSLFPRERYEDREDWASEAVISLWKCSEYEEVKCPKGFLSKVVRHAGLHRKRTHVHQFNSGFEPITAIVEDVVGGVGIGSELAVEAFVKTLEARQSQVLYLLAQGFTHEEIAELLSLKEHDIEKSRKKIKESWWNFAKLTA